MNKRAIHLDQLTVDRDVQSRVRLDSTTVSDYAEAMKDGSEFPEIIVFDDGVLLWLSDGFHRVAAAREAGIDELKADVRVGGKREAILHACGANWNHGLRRTNEDKRQAVLLLLEDSEWSRWSDHEIARRCHVSPTTVGLVRRSLSNLDSENCAPSGELTARESHALPNSPGGDLAGRISSESTPPISPADARDSGPSLHLSPDPSTPTEERAVRTYTTKHGTVATMNVMNIGDRRSSRTTRPAAVGETKQFVDSLKPERLDAAVRVLSEGQEQPNVLIDLASVAAPLAKAKGEANKINQEALLRQATDAEVQEIANEIAGMALAILDSVSTVTRTDRPVNLRRIR